MNPEYTVAVLGIGNLLRRDDGVGIRIIQCMRDNIKYRDVDLIDGGTALDLLTLLNQSVRQLIIVDALQGGGEPGSIYHLAIGDENIPDDTPVSLHGMGILDSLLMMKKLDMKRPRVTLVGIEPLDTSNGIGLSPQLEAVIPAVIDAIDNEISACR